MIPLHDEGEKTCQFNQNSKRYTVPLIVEKLFFFGNQMLNGSIVFQ